jgi:prepilin-type N-terminal cleavage/methylation domain-containing protein
MFIRKRTPSRGDEGLTMIELLVAMVVLAIGMAGAMILIASAITSNNRNKLDTTATVLSEMMLERISAAGVGASSTFTLTDCLGNNLTIDPRGTTAGQGAALAGNGDIDFSGAINPNAGFSVNYVTCRAAGSTSTYNIRWNVRVLQGTAGQPFTKRVTVSTRQIGSAGTGSDRLKFFAPPVTLRTVLGI